MAEDGVNVNDGSTTPGASASYSDVKLVGKTVLRKFSSRFGLRRMDSMEIEASRVRAMEGDGHGISH
ncbi:hypothetical protein R1flu_003796 [Riccia fluitans]|uniref:Uncharacterized protein n=1 Tax=Riccia fluitans TaxID=41844 RepID=A0ABD1YA20_9MARC